MIFNEGNKIIQWTKKYFSTNDELELDSHMEKKKSTLTLISHHTQKLIQDGLQA